MEQFLDWWGYFLIALLPGAGFVFGVAWARREIRSGRDPMLTSESWWQKHQRRRQLMLEIERTPAEFAASQRALTPPQRVPKARDEAEYRVPTPV